MINTGIRSGILTLLLLVSATASAQDTLYRHGGFILTDNHNYKDSSISFGPKIDGLLKTEKRNKNQIKKLAVKSFGADYDPAQAEDGCFSYAKQGIDICPLYGEKLDFMNIRLWTQYSKEVMNNSPIEKLTAQEVIRLLGKPYYIGVGDRGLDYFIYFTGKTKIIFNFYFTPDDCFQKPCDKKVKEINIYYNKNGAGL